MGLMWSKEEDFDINYEENSSYSEDEEIFRTSTERSPEIEKYDNSYEKRQQLCDSLNVIRLDSATDAVNAATPTVQITLSLDDVRNIELNLDDYEKVSLVYLLEDNPQRALQNLCVLLNVGSENLLYNWAKYQFDMSQKWEDKFVEALCIVKNYQVLKKFGFKKEDLDARFVPRHSFTSDSVSRVKKVLYFLCENLTQKEANNLLKLVFEDFNSKGLESKSFDSMYLELYLLHWENVGYIKHNDLSNLYALLKQLEHFEICDKLKRVVPVEISKQVSRKIKTKTIDAVPENKKTPKIFEDILNDSSLLDIVSVGSSSSTTFDSSTEKKYDIDPNNPGICLIINQEYFYAEPKKEFQHLLPQEDKKLEERKGTQKDKEDLEKTFQNFGFKTKVVENLTHTEIIKQIEQVVQSITTESSVFVCIMSHGDEGVVYGVNSCRVSVNTIKQILSTKNRNNLTGKPKVLILQSCQGTTCQKIFSKEDEFVRTDGPSFGKPEVIPPTADLFTFWATVPGYGAIRHERTGSWFIQSLCEQMKTLGNRYHFEDICTEVIGDVSSKIWSQKTKNVAMVPLKDSTLRKKLYLPPMKF